MQCLECRNSVLSAVSLIKVSIIILLVNLQPSLRVKIKKKLLSYMDRNSCPPTAHC